MKRLWASLTVVLLLCLTAGCSSGSPGQNRDKDKPRAGDATVDK
jgi:hypothetical protein